MFARIDYDFFAVASVCALQKPWMARDRRGHGKLSRGDSSPLLSLPDVVLTSITNSSLEVKPGSLFVPLVDKRDGHEFIEDAISRGAAGFFLKAGHPIRKKLSEEILARAIEVADPLLALATLAYFHRRCFAPLVIAVTGSNGKTTTKEMLAQIFVHALGEQCIYTEKNYNNHIGLPFTIFSIRKNTRVAILEMGMNHAGEIGYLSRIAEPHIAAISSIGHAHIEFFASRARIAAAKAEILEGMPQGGLLYVPHDIAEIQTIATAAKRAKIQLKKINPQKKIERGRAVSLQIQSAGPKGFDLKIDAERAFFPYPNAAWVTNLALASEVALDVGIDVASVIRVAENFKPAAGRMQLKKGYFDIVDDGYNANPDSAIASIDSALQIAAGKPVICVFGDFKELGRFSRKLHTWTGREAARKGIAAFYGVGSDMRYAVHSFQKLAGKKRPSYFFSRDQIKDLILQLKKESRDSLILIKGSRSMHMEEIVECFL